MSDTATQSVRESFIDQYNNYRAASVGIVAVRTSEPYFAIDCLRQMAAALPRPLRIWDGLAGWQEMSADLESTKVKEKDDIFDLVPALAVIERGSNDNETFYPSNAIYAMSWPHMWVNNTPVAIAALGHLTTYLPRTKKRLVMIIPGSYELPPELTQLIPIIELGLPQLDELRQMFDDIVADTPPPAPEAIAKFSSEEISSIINAGSGMTRKEFQDAVSITVIKAIRAQTITPEFISNSMLVVKTEIVKRTNVLEVMPVAKMDDVGGMDELKAYITEMAHTYTDTAHRRSVDRFRGIGAFGPPGTGKSLMAKAVAAALGLPAIRFDVSKVFDKFVGNSEHNVRNALAICEAMAPCVVMVDEIDKLFNTQGGGGDSGVGQRVLGALLTFMQESTRPVAWVVTGNRVENLPSEILRPGRLNAIFAVTTPNEEERTAILTIHLRKRGVSYTDVPDMDKVLEKSAGYVGAELEEAVSEAVRKASITAGDDDSKFEVTGDMLISALGNMKPLSEAFKDQFDAMQRWAEQNAKPASSGAARKRTRARAAASVAEVGGRRFDTDAATPATPKDGF